VTPANVVWIRLEKPTFDLIGVVLSSLGITGLCVGVALFLGCCWGLALIRRARTRPAFQTDVQLGLDVAAR
jgi:hypothetical protein